MLRHPQYITAPHRPYGLASRCIAEHFGDCPHGCNLCFKWGLSPKWEIQSPLCVIKKFIFEHKQIMLHQSRVFPNFLLTTGKMLTSFSFAGEHFQATKGN